MIAATSRIWFSPAVKARRDVLDLRPRLRGRLASTCLSCAGLHRGRDLAAVRGQLRYAGTSRVISS